MRNVSAHYRAGPALGRRDGVGRTRRKTAAMLQCRNSAAAPLVRTDLAALIAVYGSQGSLCIPR